MPAPDPARQPVEAARFVRKVLVCGSRDWTDAEAIRAELAKLNSPFATLIHGAAKGADSIAAEIGPRYVFRVEAFPADWDRHGKQAGIIRNLAMLNERPDLVLAFQINGSRGTQHTIDEARRRGIPTRVVTPPDSERS